MNKLNLKLTAGTAIVGAMFAFGASAAPVVESNDAAVTLVEALVVSANDDMNFGRISKPAGSPETVILSSSGTITGGTATTLSGITPAEGTVSITGSSSETVSVTVTDTTTATGLALSDFTSATFGGQSLSGGSLSGASLTGGADTLSLGATLTVSSTASAGLNTPTYNVSVDYN